MVTILALLLSLNTPGPEELDRRARWAEELRPEARVVRVSNRVVEVGNCTYYLDDGVVLPIKAGRREFTQNAGVVFEGQGRVTVRFETRADAWAFANHMVLKGQASVEMMDAIARGQSYTVPIAQGVLISTHPKVNDLLLPPLSEGEEREDISNYDMVMVVNDEAVVAPFARAGATLPKRVSTLAAGGLDIRPRIAQEMLMASWGGLPWDERLIVGDFLTEDHFNVARGATSQAQGSQDRWLTCVADAGGTMGLGEQNTVFAHGRDPDDKYHRVRFTGAGFPLDKRIDPQTPGLRVRAVEPVDAQVTVDARPTHMRKYIQAQVRSRLTFRATRDGVQVVALNLPKYEANDNTFKINRIADREGKELSWTSLSSDLFGDKVDANNGMVWVTNAAEEDSPEGSIAPEIGSGGSAEISGLSLGAPVTSYQAEAVNMSVDRAGTDFVVLILLDEPLKDGQEIEINLDWEAQWNFVQASSTRVGGEVRSLGPTTGFRNLLPELWPSQGGTRWTHQTTITVPSSYDLGLAASGEVVSESWDPKTELLTLTVRGEQDLRPGLAVGKWARYQEPAASGFPGVRISVNPSESYALDTLAPELRRVMGFYARLMPEIDVDQFEIYQGRDLGVTRVRNEPGDGMLEINQLQGRSGGAGANTLYRELDPYMPQTLLSREIGRRYWDGLVQPGGTREAWLSLVMPEVYSAFYVRGVQGTQAYFDWMETLRGYLEDPQEQVDRLGVPYKMRPALDLSDNGTEGTQAWYGGTAQRYYGLYVVGNMLRYRVGENVYYEALDRLLMERKDGYVTTELLKESLELGSGQDLDDFFDFWVHGGLIPGVVIEVQQEGETVRGCITSDVPYGNFDLPVVVSDVDGSRQVGALVDVDFGHGQFMLTSRQGEVTVEPDPEGLILLSKRQVEWVESLDHCWVEPVEAED